MLRARIHSSALFLIWLVVLTSAGADDSATSKAVVRFDVSDRAGDPVPCRIHLKNHRGEPQKASGHPFWHDHFIGDGRVTLQLEPGSYAWDIERGPEYERQSGSLELSADQTQRVTVSLSRIADLRDEGWFCGDLHVHRSPEQIELLMMAEDLDLAPVITWWNTQNAWANRPIPPSTVKRFDGHRMYEIMAGEDEREGGALLYFGLRRPIDLTAQSRELPSPMVFCAEARHRNPDVWIDIEKPFWWDVPVWLASGQMNSIGLANNHMCRSQMYASEAWGKPRDVARLPAPRGNGFWTQEIYYHILSAGLRIPPSAGSASGVLPNPVGYNRVYVHLGRRRRPGEPFVWADWFDGLARGRCFVTNGPLLRAQAGGQLPGGTFRLPADQPIEIDWSFDLTSRDHVPSLEIIHNGKVIETLDCSAATQQHLTTTTKVHQPGWILVRAIADVDETFRFASTAPWYIESESASRAISKRSAEFFVQWVEQRMKRIEQNVVDPVARRSVLKPHQQAHAFWLQRVAEATRE